MQRNLILSTLSDYIIPLPDEKDVEDTASWTDRFLLVDSSLTTETQRAALLHATHLADKVDGSVWSAYLEACQKYNARRRHLPPLPRPGRAADCISRLVQGGLVDEKETKDALRNFLKKVVGAIAGAFGRACRSS